MGALKRKTENLEDVEFKPGDKIVIMDGARQPVCEVKKVLTWNLLYIGYNKGKASSCRKFWTIDREAVIRMAKPHEITL